MSQWLTARLKTVVTLVTLVLLVVFGAFWGLHAMTQPFPSRAAAALCAPRQVAAGTQIYPAEVLVNVYNASTRGGLATQAMGQFVDRGFAEGLTGNAPDEKVSSAVIWTDDPKRPDVLLVLKHLGPGAKAIKHATLDVGVDVLVGPKFTKLAAKPHGVITAQRATEICSPPSS